MAAMFKIDRNDGIALIRVSDISRIDVAGPNMGLSGQQGCRLYTRDGQTIVCDRQTAERAQKAIEGEEAWPVFELKK